MQIGGCCGRLLCVCVAGRVRTDKGNKWLCVRIGGVTSQEEKATKEASLLKQHDMTAHLLHCASQVVGPHCFLQTRCHSCLHERFVCCVCCALRPGLHSFEEKEPHCLSMIALLLRWGAAWAECCSCLHRWPLSLCLQHTLVEKPAALGKRRGAQCCLLRKKRRKSRNVCLGNVSRHATQLCRHAFHTFSTKAATHNANKQIQQPKPHPHKFPAVDSSHPPATQPPPSSLKRKRWRQQKGWNCWLNGSSLSLWMHSWGAPACWGWAHPLL